MIVHGQGGKGGISNVEHVNVGFNIRSLTLGLFTWNRGNKSSMAVLSEDGSIHLLQRNDLDILANTAEEIVALKRNINRNPISPIKGTGTQGPITRVVQSSKTGVVTGNVQWSLAKQLNVTVSNAAASSARQMLVTSQISPREINDLLIVDQSSNKINLIRPVDDRIQPGGAITNAAAQAQPDSAPITMDVEGSPTAVLAMPRKVNGERDMIVLRAGQAAPTSVIVTPQAAISVDRTDDSHTSACTAAANDCSLRGAIDLLTRIPGLRLIFPRARMCSQLRPRMKQVT